MRSSVSLPRVHGGAGCEADDSNGLLDDGAASIPSLKQARFSCESGRDRSLKRSELTEAMASKSAAKLTNSALWCRATAATRRSRLSTVRPIRRQAWPSSIACCLLHQAADRRPLFTLPRQLQDLGHLLIRKLNGHFHRFASPKSDFVPSMAAIGPFRGGSGVVSPMKAWVPITLRASASCPEARLKPASPQSMPCRAL